MIGVNFCIRGMLHGFAFRIYVWNIMQSIVTLLFPNKTEGIHYLAAFLLRVNGLSALKELLPSTTFNWQSINIIRE